MSDDPLQKDWEWIVDVLHMSYTRVLDGQRITLRRPKSFGAKADIKWTMEDAIVRQIRTIINSAEVVDADD